MPAIWFKYGICLLLLTACARQAPVKQTLPQLNVPDSWESEHKNNKVLQAHWIRDLKDPLLEQLIQEALSNNFDLHIQRTRWRQFEARAQIAGAERKIQAKADVTAARRHQESAFSEDYTNTYTASLSLSWELDLWSKLSDRSQAAALLADASLSDYHNLRLSIASRVAQSWFTCVLNHLQIQLIKESIAAWDKTIENAESRFQRGTITALDLQRLLQARHSDAASLLERQQQYQEHKRQLSLLLGRYPSDEIEHAVQLPQLADAPPSGQPSSLLQRRHDIRAVEQRFQSQLRTLKAAKKDLLPSFRLTGDAGYTSDELKSVFKPQSFFWNAIAGITAPIFQGGRLRATVELRKAELEEQTAIYGRTVLEACREVEQSLDAEQLIRQRITALQQALTHAETSYRQAEEQYLKGLVEINDVLEVKRNLLNSQVRLLSAQHALVVNRIQLHRALGGDFLEEMVATP